MGKGVSIIVCCYNSQDRLAETIKHLANQEVPSHVPWEVIVVNNASTDNTTNVAIEEAKKHCQLDSKFHLVDQPKPGLSYAREIGVERANYEYVIFCDDDNWLSRNYVTDAYAIMEADKMIGALGGKSEGVTDALEFPDWFNSVKSWYAVGNQGEHSGDVSAKCNIWGAGMITRKELYVKCHPQEYPTLMVDRKGNNLTSGGDTEFCLRLVLKDYKLYYDESLSFKHFVSQDKLNLEYKNRLRNEGLAGSLEMRKYWQLCVIKNARPLPKLKFIAKTALGFLSAKILNRKSWSYDDVIRTIFYAYNIDLGVDANAKLIRGFYKNHHFTE